MGKKKKSEGYQVQLPGGSKAPLHNGDRGFFVRHVHTLRALDGSRSHRIRLTDQLQVGRRGSWTNFFPDNKDVSKHHTTIAVLNNYYFMKDAGSRYGTYLRLESSGKNARVELHKGMIFAVGQVHLKVQSIEGDAADNQHAKRKAEAKAIANAEAARAARATTAPPEELGDDEEYADDDSESGDDDGKNAKLEGPPVLFLRSVDKRLQIRGRIRGTSTIGAEAHVNKVQITEAIAKQKKVDGVHSRIVLEDGRFYLEDVSRGFGTYVGFPRKRFLQLNRGDQLLLGCARAKVESKALKLQLVDGLLEKILGSMALNAYSLRILATGASIEERLQAARGDTPNQCL